MKKRKAAATTIKKPTPEKKIKDFTITKEDCDKLKVDQLFEDLPTIKWSDLDKLIDQLINVYQDTLGSTTAFNIVLQSLESIYSKRSNNKNLCHYVSKCTEYLKQDHIRILFDKKFASKVSKFQVNELKKKNRLQGERATVLITHQAGEKYYEELLSASQLQDDDEYNDLSVDAEPSTSKRRKTHTNEEQEEDSDALSNDDSFHSNDYHPLCKNIYLCTNICREFNIDKNPSWLVNGFNISNALSQFGWSSLSLHDKGDALSDMRLLSLDHIYAFANDISSSVTKYLGQDVHFDVVQDLSLQLFEIFPEISPIISGLCIQLSTLHSAVPWIKMMELASSAILKTKGQDMETILYGSIIYKTITTLAGMNTALDNEDTFIHNCLHNLLASIFSCDKCFIQEWANKSLESSSTYQPDWCASVKFWKNKYNIIATEAKSKANQNRGIISDYVKLGRELKLMLEKLIYSGVNEPEVYGLLLKGGVLEIYMMDIKVDGIYRFVEIDTVNLVTNFTEMTNLTRTLPILYRLKERVLSIAKRLELVELQKSKGITVNPALPVSWLRGSMDPKMKVLK